MGSSSADTMRIVIVADMHANIYAAEAFLRHLDVIGDVDRILNLGDFVQIGPHPAEIADLVMGDPRLVNISGNNEWSLIVRDPDGFPPSEVAHQDWTVDQLGPRRLIQIAEMPRSLELTVAGIEISATHEPPEELSGLTLHKQDMVLDAPDVSCSVWKLFGHTHRQACLRRGEILCVNPGSLGCSKESVASFCIAEFDDHCGRFTFDRIPYDASKLGDDFRSRGVPDRQMLMATFYGIGDAAR